MVQPYKAGPFLGINNKLPAEKMRAQFPLKGNYVRDAVNVDLTDVGTFRRRPGVRTAAVSGSRCRSLWSDGTIAYYADDGVLMRFDGTDAEEFATLSAADANVAFTQTPRGVVWSDGALLELIANDESRPLTVPGLNPLPVVTAATGGGLQAGLYSIAFANADATGERSELSAYTDITVPEGGVINLVFQAGRTLDTQVFVTAAGGSQLFRETTVPAADTTAVISLVTSQGEAISDQIELPMPPGTMVRYYRGRLLTVIDNFIFYSLPYNYGRYYARKNFIPLDGPVTLCEPSDDGVYIATAKNTWFARGADISTASLVPLAPYGAVPNTAVAEPNSDALWWSTPRGAVRAEGGAIELKQDANIAFGKATAGAALLREENGLVQLVSVLSNVSPTGAASASSYMDAEVVN